MKKISEKKKKFLEEVNRKINDVEKLSDEKDKEINDNLYKAYTDETKLAYDISRDEKEDALDKKADNMEKKEE